MRFRFRLFFACSLCLTSIAGLSSVGCGGMVAEDGPGSGSGQDSGPSHSPEGGPVGHAADAGQPDPADAGVWDAEPTDAEPWDAERPDADPWDAEPPDAEPWDAEPWDGGVWDGGVWDAAPWDAGGWDGAPWEDAGDAGLWDAGEWPDAPPDAPPDSPPDAPPSGIVLPTGCDPSNAAGAIDAWLAFDAPSAGASHVFVIRPNGCDLRQLTFGSNDEREPAFSPDGAYLTFSSDRGGSTQIWRMDLATGARNVLTASATNARHSAWSPDGSRITFVTDDGVVWLMASDGSNLTRVAQDGSSWGTAYHAPTFSHDGTQILFDRFNEIDAVHLDGTAKRYVVSNWTTPEGNPEMAPNGLRVAYDVYCGAGQAIFTAPYTGLPGDPCSGGRITPDAFGPSANPAWGPNSLFAFERTSSGRLAVIDATTGAAWELLDEASLQTNPTWAPAGWQPH